MKRKIEAKDREILALLKQDSRRSISEMALVTGLSRLTVRQRIKRMRENSIIKRFTLEVDDTTSREVTAERAFFHLQLHRPVCHLVHQTIKNWPEIIGCWSMAGEVDMVLLVSCANVEELERLRDKLARHKEVRHSVTLPILKEWMDR